MQGETGEMTQQVATPDKDEIERKKKEVKSTLCCPYCGEGLKKWQVPQTVFTEWPNDFMYVCMNDECSYFVRGWAAMSTMGHSCSYRLMYDPLGDSCQPIPVFNALTLKDGIIDGE